MRWHIFCQPRLAQGLIMRYGFLAAAKFGAAAALILTLVLLSIIYFRKDALSSSVLYALDGFTESNLAAEKLEVEIFSAFPRITLHFHGVTLAGRDSSSFLQAKELFLYLDPISALAGNVRIKELLIRDGSLHILRQEDGKFNYAIFETNDGNRRGGATFTIAQADLINMHIHFNDPQKRQNFEIQMHNCRLQGSVSPREILLNLEGKYQTRTIDIAKNNYLVNQPGKLLGQIRINLTNQNYFFSPLELQFGNDIFLVEGNIHDWDQLTFYDLTVSCNNGELNSILTYLPAQYQNVFRGYDMYGSVAIDGSITGRMLSSENPAVKFDLSLSDGNLHHPHLSGEGLSQIKIEAHFDNGAFRRLSSAQLESSIHCNYQGEAFQANLRLEEIADPKMDLAVHGVIPAHLVFSMLPDSGITQVAGSFELDTFLIDNLWLANADFTDLEHLLATVSFRHFKLHYDGKPLEIQSGTVRNFGNTRFIDLIVRHGNSSAVFNGTAAFVGEALEATDWGLMQLDLALEADHLDLDAFAPSARPISHASSTDFGTRLVSEKTAIPRSTASGKLSLQAGSLRYAGHEISGASLHATSTGEIVDFEIAGHTKGGDFSGFGNVHLRDTRKLSMQLNVDGIGLRECFRDFDNFNQNVLTWKNLRGGVTSQMLIDATWDEFGNLIKDQLRLQAGMSIKNGALLDFALLEHFSRYIHAEDLRNIQFQKLDNFIEIKNGNIFIPVMFIQSNAANLAINGVHTLNNDVYYNLKINAGQVLGNKLSRHDPNLRPIPARKTGFFNLYYSITGNIDDFKYKSDKRAVISSFQQSEEIREEIRSALSGAFGTSIDLIEPEDWQDIPEYESELETGPEEYLAPIHRQE